jgi:hypothetical protein
VRRPLGACLPLIPEDERAHAGPESAAAVTVDERARMHVCAAGNPARCAAAAAE